MFNLIRKSLPHFTHSVTPSSSTLELHILLQSFSSLISPKPTSDSVKDHSFVVNYLINKCGVSLRRSILVSKYLNFDKSDKPDAVISFLKNQGFSEVQVLKLIRTYPRALMFDTKKTLLPKIEFLRSQGLSRANIATLAVASPEIFTRNLDKTIIPSFNYLKNLFRSAEEAMLVLSRGRRFLGYFEHNVITNIEILKKAGVPEHRIKCLLRSLPLVLTRNPKIFNEAVEEVKKMGIDPLKSTFYIGLNVILGLSRSSWKKKIKVYKRWGCSEDNVMKAFVSNPWCMSVSEEKIDAIMGHFVNEMGCDPEKLMWTSILLSYSLNRRIIPRCSVYKFLLSKGLIKKHISLFYLMQFSEEKFSNKYVKCYEKEAPELLQLYQEKMKLSR